MPGPTDAQSTIQPRLVLASASPRRRELLARLGFPFEIVTSPAEEIHDSRMAPARLCELNAQLKAAAVAQTRPKDVVIGADTLVFHEGEALGKPADLTAARAMLRRLAGHSHQVCTGVCVVHPGGQEKIFHELTEVCFRNLDEEQIDDYLSLVNPLDKAGGYGIQEYGERIISEIRGGFENVMGLPLQRLQQVLQGIGLR